MEIDGMDIDKVFAAISDESLSLTTSPLNPESSNKIFKLLCPIEVPLADKLLEHATRILTITEACLTGIEMTNEYISMLLMYF